MRRSILAAAAATVFASLAVAGAASAQTTIRPGQTVNGELTSRDARWDGDNTPMDCYVLQTTAGQSYVIDYRSDAFDAFLAIGRGRNCQGGNHTAFDDDSGGGLHSRLTLPGDGQVWFIRANAIAETSAGAYSLAVSGAAAPAPSRPVGKPPAGGGSAPPANNNNNNNSGAGQFAGMQRPTDPQERYTWDVICSAVDTVALIESAGELSDDALMAWVNESAVLHEAASASARAIGKTEDQMSNEAATYGAAYYADGSTLLTDVPPMELRAACLAVAPR
ncbi:MAG: hypothetical protein V4707_05880 [Pseudomonadota bacterium]